jgi:hypothetical protein
MRCPTCGAESRPLAKQRNPLQHTVWIHRVCDRDHPFETMEVHPTQLADKRELECAVRNINRRIRLYERDIAIAADPRPTAEVAAEHDITEARVRQIRRAHAKFSANSERTQQ